VHGDGFREALHAFCNLLPDGLFLTARRANHSCSDCGVSSLFCKNISVFTKCKSGYMICHPDPLRGALRNVINAGRGAVDADGAFDESA
jgi:hypothetical protein